VRSGDSTSRRLLILGCLPALLGACATFLSHNGPRADAPRLYSGTRLDWAAITGDRHYLEHYKLRPPPFPAADLPLSLAADTAFLPLTIPRATYQWLFVPAEGW
jgi:uncharacterized protein YceK